MITKKSKYIIDTQELLNEDILKKIKAFCFQKTDSDIKSISNWILENWRIDLTLDQDIILGYLKDWSNIEGYAIGMCRPKNNFESSILIQIFNELKIPFTISAGRTNLTGSATPNGGFIISTEKLNRSKPTVKNNHVLCSPSSLLEDMRQEVLNETNSEMYYPVDPTSRKEATIGGTISCNASGFVPGKKGATRHWVRGLDIILPNGKFLSCKRGEYISKNNFFQIDGNKIKIPEYNRPKIKNASGPYTGCDGDIDFVDLIVGSEGMFGLITNCSLFIESRPRSFLDLFIILGSEKNAFSLFHFLNTQNKIETLNAFEYFGYNCQKYMNNKQYFFNKNSEVGVYLQIPIMKQSEDQKCSEWSSLLLNSNCNIHGDNIYVLNDKKSWDLFFNSRHSIPENALKESKKLGGVSIITDIIVPKEKFAQLIEGTHRLIKNSKIEYLLFGHLGDCHLHFHMIPEKREEITAKKTYDQIVDLSSSLGGVYSAEHGTGRRKKNDFIKCYGYEAVRQLYNIKKSLDPNELLNSGNIIT